MPTCQTPPNNQESGPIAEGARKTGTGMNKILGAVAAFALLMVIMLYLQKVIPGDPERLIKKINDPVSGKEIKAALVKLDMRAVNPILLSDIDMLTKAKLINRMSYRARKRSIENIYLLADRGDLMNDEHPALQPLHLLEGDIRGLLLEGALAEDINLKKTFLRIIEKRVGLTSDDSEENRYFRENERFIFEIRKYLKSPEPRLRMYCGAILGRLGVGTLADLNPLLDDSDLEVAETAAKAMGRLGITDRLEKILELALCSEPVTRAAMMDAATELGGVKAKDVLEKNLLSGDIACQYVAAKNLGKVGDKESVKKLRMLLDAGVAVPLKAAILGALIRLGHPKYYENLIDMLSGLNQSNQGYVIKNLYIARIGSVPEGLRYGTNALSTERAKWKKWWEEQGRKEVFGAGGSK